MRAARWRSRRPVLVGLAVLVLLTALAWFGWAGPLLVVRQVSVDGVTGERAAQVRAAARVPAGEPLAQVDTAALSGRVRALPFVASVQVDRSWPTTLGLRVEARTPVGAVPLETGGYQLVDAAGVAYAYTGTLPPGVPLVEVSVSQEARPAMTAALQVLTRLPDALRREVRRVSASSPDAVRLRVAETTVVWGSAEQSERKAQVFTALRAAEAVRRTEPRVYDVSSPGTPALR